jgi:CMP-N-acetylneuraminic acid synthetase
MTTKIIALVPMRHDSERVPGKNYRLLAGKPLFHHILETLQACPEIHQIVVDTDSTEISAGILKSFPAVLVLERPPHLREGDVPMNEVLLHDTSQVDADFYLQTHSTNPLLKAETVSGAIQALLAAYPAYDSMFSVTRCKPACGINSAGRSTTTRPSCSAPRTCRRFTRKIPALYMFTRREPARPPQPHGFSSADVPEIPRVKRSISTTAPYMLPFLERFRPVFDHYGIELIVPDVQERMEEADLLKYAGQFDGAICGDDRYTPPCSRPAPRA